MRRKILPIMLAAAMLTQGVLPVAASEFEDFGDGFLEAEMSADEDSQDALVSEEPAVSDEVLLDEEAISDADLLIAEDGEPEYVYDELELAEAEPESVDGNLEAEDIALIDAENLSWKFYKSYLPLLSVFNS